MSYDVPFLTHALHGKCYPLYAKDVTYGLLYRAGFGLRLF